MKIAGCKCDSCEPKTESKGGPACPLVEHQRLIGAVVRWTIAVATLCMTIYFSKKVFVELPPKIGMDAASFIVGIALISGLLTTMLMSASFAFEISPERASTSSQRRASSIFEYATRIFITIFIAIHISWIVFRADSYFAHKPQKNASDIAIDDFNRNIRGSGPGATETAVLTDTRVWTVSLEQTGTGRNKKFVYEIDRNSYMILSFKQTSP